MGNKPKKTFRFGAISASVWENEIEIEKGKFIKNYSVSIVRNYQTKEQKWASTPSFRINDLPKVEIVSRQAYEYLGQQLKDEEPQQPQIPEVNMTTGQQKQYQGGWRR